MSILECNDAEARDYYLLRRNAADHFFDGGAMSGLSQQTLGESLIHRLAVPAAILPDGPVPGPGDQERA